MYLDSYFAFTMQDVVFPNFLLKHVKVITKIMRNDSRELVGSKKINLSFEIYHFSLSFHLKLENLITNHRQPRLLKMRTCHTCGPYNPKL